MTNKMIEKDERATFIENVSYKLGYNLVAYALLLDVMYRGLRFNEAPWDLLVIIIVSGLVMTAYQYKHKILGKTWIKTVTLTIVISFIVAYLIVKIIL